MKKLHLNVLRKVESMLNSIGSDYPGLKIEYKAGVLTVDEHGAEEPSKRRQWGDAGAKIRNDIRAMAVGQTLVITPPPGMTPSHLQSYVSSIGTHAFGSGGFTTARDNEHGQVEVMRNF